MGHFMNKIGSALTGNVLNLHSGNDKEEIMEDLRKCTCGGNPIIKTDFYPGTAYKMYRICCEKCFIKTNACRRLNDAKREWNNPQEVHLN